MNLSEINVKGSKGQLATIMNLIIAVFVVGAIGIFAFELTRYFLARDELKTNVEVAALSCQTTLASSGDPTSATNQSTAETTALTLFRQNSILGQTMSSATAVTSPTALEPAPGQAQICFQFLDPLTRLPVNSSGAGVGSGVTDPAAAGTLIQAIGSYCYSPAFGQFIGLANAQFTFQVSALAGIPKIDLMVLLDISGAMDDNTSVSFYQRYEGPTGTNWMIPPSPGSPGSTAQGPITGVFCPAFPGALMPNALQPCQYEALPNSTCLRYSEGPLAPASNGLAAAGMGTPPPPWCGVPLAMLHAGTKHIARVHSTHKHMKNLKIARTIRTKKNRLLGLNRGNKKQNISFKSNNPGLIDICQKICGKNATSSLINKTMVRQLDDKFSKISFKPNFECYPSGLNNNTTAGTTSSGVVYGPYDPANNPTPVPGTYIGSDGMQYFPHSRVAGSGANTGPAVMPTISANRCVGNVSTVTGFGSAAPSVFTGMVADGPLGASNPNISGMTFNSMAAVIEASLGDLESPALATAAGIDTNALGVTPQAGWYAFYYLATRPFLQPMMSILNGLIGFINEMSIIADIHYGLIAFNDTIGTGPTSVSAAINNVSSDYNFTTPNPNGSASITSTFPLPNILLSTAISNQANVINVIPTLSVWGNRNVTQALTAAASQLQSNGRPGANKAILLITCGAPSGSDTPTAAIAEATTIGQSGIPVYVICTSLNSAYDSADDAAYTDVGGSSGGVAAVSGHGAKYFRVDFVDPTTTGNQLVTIYGNMARRLVSLVQSN
jgi:hypothetical protein